MTFFGRSRLPRRIYSLWLQGAARAPAIVRLCFDRWERLNPDWVLTVLDANDVNRLLDGLALCLDQRSAQVLSDVTRIHLLRTHGGLWTDATVLPLKPLQEWIDEGRAARALAAFEAPARDRALSSWLLAAPRGSYVMRRWHAEVARYWAKPRTLLCQTDGTVTIPSDPVAAVAPDSAIEGAYPYFWLHYLFGYLLRIDGRFRQAWERSDRRPAEPAHALQALFRQGGDRTDNEIRDEAAKSVVQKLDWRATYPVDRLTALL